MCCFFIFLESKSLFIFLFFNFFVIFNSFFNFNFENKISINFLLLCKLARKFIFILKLLIQLKYNYFFDLFKNIQI